MIQIESPAFSEGDAVPTRFTCDGENVSPPLRCPPSGAPHRYVFTVEALDAAGNVVGSGQLTTTYGR
jgi:phosphatidylethanolamine-binding protein (PEBP) family uncharacterized protein